MEKILIVIFACTLLFTTEISGQVTVGPELGISYLPFDLYGPSNNVSSNRIDLSFGIVAELPIAKKWDLNTRFTFVNRENVKWHPQELLPDTKYESYNSQDLNIGIGIYYQLFDFLKVGFGPSIVKKLNSKISVVHFEEAIERFGLMDYTLDESHMYFEINSGIKFTKGRYNLSLRYFRRFNDDWRYFGIQNFSFRNIGSNKFELTMAMMIFGYKKKK